MNIVIEVKLKMVAYHKLTMQKLNIDKVIRREYNENSEEYKTLVEMYEPVFNMKREENKDDFDAKLAESIGKDVGEQLIESVEKIAKVYKETILNDKNGWIEFGGCVFSAKDFCALQIDDYKVRVSKA